MSSAVRTSSSGSLGPLQEQKIVPVSTKRGVHRLIPPAGMTELNNVTPCWIKLAKNRSQPRLRIAIARRKLEQKAPHPVAQDIGDHPKILHERFCALEPLDVGDELADFDGVNEVSLARLAPPSFHVCHGRPRIKGCVDFNGIEVLRVVMKPLACRAGRRDKIILAISSKTSLSSRHMRMPLIPLRVAGLIAIICSRAACILAARPILSFRCFSRRRSRRSRRSSRVRTGLSFSCARGISSSLNFPTNEDAGVAFGSESGCLGSRRSAQYAARNRHLSARRVRRAAAEGAKPAAAPKDLVADRCRRRDDRARSGKPRPHRATPCASHRHKSPQGPEAVGPAAHPSSSSPSRAAAPHSKSNARRYRNRHGEPYGIIWPGQLLPAESVEEGCWTIPIEVPLTEDEP